MIRAAIATSAVCVVLIFAAIVMGIVGIWTGDDRWGDTAILVGGTAFLTLVVSWLVVAVMEDAR